MLGPDGAAFSTKKKAKDAATELEVEGRRKAPVVQKSASKYPADILWGDWWSILSATRTFEDTETGNVEASVVRRHLLPYWGKVPLNMIVLHNPDLDAGQVAVQVWIDSDPGLKTRKGMSPGYAGKIYGVFNLSLRAAVPEILSSCPTAGAKLPTPPKRKRPYATPSKIKELNIRGDYEDLLVFSTETGLRPGEVCGLHAHYYDRERGFITVAEVFVGRKNIIRHFPKDNDHRDVPLTPRANEIVERRLAGRDLRLRCPWPHVNGVCQGSLIFMTDRGKGFLPKNIHYILTAAAKRTGLPALGGGYSARHGFGTRAADGGMNVFELGEIMGHADLSMTQRYYQSSAQTKGRLTAALRDD